MATKKEVELKEETMEKSPVFVSNEKELLKKIVLLEAENSLLPQLKEEVALLKKELLSIKKSNEEISANEHNVRQHLDKFKNETSVLQNVIQSKDQEIVSLRTSKDKEIESLKSELNKLANLFDEYITSFQDQNKMLGVFFKNTQTVEKYLSIKIDEYNGGNKK
jgi:DNA repair exonuclease SbcCD ATPase subunit